MTTLKTIDGLRIGHANVYHLYNKVHDVCMLLNDSPFIHLLGLRETRLSARFSDKSLSIPQYNIIRRDAADQGHTGMALYIHQSIKMFTKRRNDLESEKVECIWVEIKHPASPAVLVGYVYRNPAATPPWFDDFVQMMDKVCESNPLFFLETSTLISSNPNLPGHLQRLCLVCANKYAVRQE